MEATTQQVLRPHAEEAFGHELKALQEADQHIRPQQDRLEIQRRHQLSRTLGSAQV